MRDINSSRMAAVAKRRRATPDELREARNRVKEIDAELRQLELLPETKRGEDREQRYERVVRLRQMREQFTSQYPKLEQRGMNSIALAGLMAIMSLLTCVFCGGGFYFAYSALTFNPGPESVTQSFWGDIQAQNYQDAYSNTLSSTLRGQLNLQQFLSDAQQADTDYGPVTAWTLISDPSKDMTKLVYKVTRQKKGQAAITYDATMQMVTQGNAWSITDLGASIYPTLGGVKPVPGSGTPTPSVSPSATP